MWDVGLYIAGTEAIVQRSCSKAAMECEDGWLDVPDVLAFYDYVGHNPAKGGLFRVGAMNSGDGITFMLSLLSFVCLFLGFHMSALTVAEYFREDLQQHLPSSAVTLMASILAESSTGTCSRVSTRMHLCLLPSAAS